MVFYDVAYNLNILTKIKSGVMKTMNIKMAGLLFLIAFLGISVCGNSQDSKPDKKSRKEARKAQLEINYRVLDSLLYSGRYVLEANYLEGKYGDRIPVSSTLNFIKVEGPRGVLQTGSDVRIGYNGVGGVTAEGSIGAYQISRNGKNLTLSVRFNLLTNLGNFDIFMTITADNNASATITGTTSGKLTWSGRLSSLDNSRVFKGSNTI
jgi:hypothetical protein